MKEKDLKKKGFSALTTLLPMIEKWRESLDSGGNFGALLTDLSKAFECLPHDLLIAKLHADGLDMSSSKFLHFYLTKRRRRFKINNTYSSSNEILFAASQGSILGPLLFNVFFFFATCFFLYPRLVLRTMLMIIN